MMQNNYRPQPHDFINSIPSIQNFEYIGRGGFGEVYAATIKDEHGNPVRGGDSELVNSELVDSNTPKFQYFEILFISFKFKLFLLLNPF